jgi:signal transduction histidine kinase
LKASLARRLFRTLVIIGFANVAITMIASEFIYEDMEEANLSIQLAQERVYFEQQIRGSLVQQWRSALLTALFVPDGTSTDLPHMLRGREPPFAAEVDLGDTTYLISIERTRQPAGVLYLAQDISVLEDREDTFQEVGITLLALGMLALSFLLARLATRRIVNPLQSLAHQIGGIEPGTPHNRLQTEYADQELVEIARTLNELLDALDTYVRREKALVSLASHELRTPVAVILGALDVLEQRDTLNEADRRTLTRIRGAANEMRADVNALLKLARHSEDMEQTELLNLEDCIREVVSELEAGSSPRHAGRVSCHASNPPPLAVADPALVRMLLRNLIQNAIRHTRQAVRVTLEPGKIEIADEGPGLPLHVQSRLEQAIKGPVPEEGLGLFIVRLICERLGWQLQLRHSGAAGTVLNLHFSAAPLLVD